MRLTTAHFQGEGLTEDVVKPGMKELSYQDARQLLAARGWLELGDATSAGEELADIAPGEQAHPAVLEVRYAIHAKGQHWDLASQVAEQLTSLLPGNAGTWISLAYATRRKTGGGIPAAKAILLAAELMFPDECIIPFNLACYFSQLCEFDQAEQWLKKAAAIDEKTIRILAGDDPDLKPLWESMGGRTIWTKET